PRCGASVPTTITAMNAPDHTHPAEVIRRVEAAAPCVSPIAAKSPQIAAETATPTSASAPGDMKPSGSPPPLQCVATCAGSSSRQDHTTAAAASANSIPASDDHA